MATILAANALTTLQDVKDELSITSDATDSVLSRYINAVSEFIAGYCDRQFHHDAAKVENVAGYGGHILRVGLTPLKTITSITIDGDIVDSENYEIHEAAIGTIYRQGEWLWTTSAVQYITRTPIAGQERFFYVVTYAGGYITPKQVADDATLIRDLPWDIEQAAIDLVVMRFRERGRDRSIKKEKLLSHNVTYGDVKVPETIVSTLDLYRRLAVA